MKNLDNARETSALPLRTVYYAGATILLAH